MIGKVMTGKSFGGCIRYVVQKQDAVILDAAGVRTQQVDQVIADFNLQRKLNPNLGKAVGHIALSWSVHDISKLNDETMVNIAKEYLQKMKILDTQFLMVKHQDKIHPHLHIVYNRVNNQGKTISDNFQKQRNVQVAKHLTLKHGLYLSPGKTQVNRQQLKGEDKVKYELFDTIKQVSKQVKNILELKQVLAKQGITTLFKFKSGGTEIQGISFSKGEYKFKGSEIDRSLSYAKLYETIHNQQEQQQNPGQGKTERSLADQLREVILNQDEQTSINNPKIQRGTYQIADPSHGLQPTLSAGADLLSGLLGNINSENEEPERRRRKKRERKRSNSISR